MGKLVVLEIGDGDFECGFPVTLQIGDDGCPPFIKVVGKLPPSPEIPEQYMRWKRAYLSSASRPRVKIAPMLVTNVSLVSLKEDWYLLQDSINNWLSSKEFKPILETLLITLIPVDEIRMLIQTQNSELLKLPWHLWNFFEHYPNAEVALSSPAYRQLENVKKIVKRNLIAPVKILVILGNIVEIGVQIDRDLLEKLTGAKVCVLVEPTRQEINDKVWEQDWDILFFAGHSSSHPDYKTGDIAINQTDSLTISELKYALRKAIQRGLQLAIFNSCDGLGLARDLADWNMPQLIIMREPVPDLVAQQFLKYFLDAFAGGKSLYLSVREARERLQGLEDEFPCATWLPIIFQNPVVVPPTWQKQDSVNLCCSPSSSKPRFGRVVLKLFLTGMMITSLLVIAGRFIRNPKIKNQQEQISLGEEILVNSVTNSIYKKKGVQAFAHYNFEEARQYFQQSLKLNRNDPETLIYLNNAKVGNSRALKIAVVVPISSNSDVAQEILRGVAQAQNEINSKGGINGKLMQVEIANDDNNPEKAKQIATELIADSNILAVVGHSSSNVSIAAVPVYQEGGLVIISPTNSAPKLSGISKYFFRTIPSTNLMASRLANYAIKNAHTKVAICADFLSDYGTSFANEFSFGIISNGGKVINVDCDLSAPDFNPSMAVSQAINNGVDAMLLAPSVSTTNKALEVANANQGRLVLFGTDDLYNSKTLQLGQGSVKNLVLVVPWHPTKFSKNTFVENATQLWGGIVNWRTAMAYDATQVIIKGLMQSDNRKELQNVLSSPGFSVSGATENIQFLQSGDSKRPGMLIKVVPNSQSEAGYEFFSVSGVNRTTDASD